MGRIDYLFMFGGTDGCDPLVHYTEMDEPGGIRDRSRRADRRRGVPGRRTGA